MPRQVKWFVATFLIMLNFTLSASHLHLADSIRIAYKLPAIGYAAISSDSILEINVLGVKKLGSDHAATLDDHFRIGSNTKAITAFMAALIVHDGKLDWETKFFDLFPDWKAHSLPCYHQLTLIDLLSFRNWLPMWTYTFHQPRPAHIKGNALGQRMNFGKWIFRQPEVHAGTSYNHSNLGYVAAGLMLEQATGSNYEDLAAVLGKRLDIEIGFGQPNANDPNAIWGHDANLNPEPPSQNVRLNWLMAAGNIQLSLPDYARFLQHMLLGLQGKSMLLPQADYQKLLFGLPDFALGWFWETSENGERIAHNLGNPGTFLSRVLLNPSQDRAYIVLTNCMTGRSYEGTDLLIQRLQD